MRGMNVHLHGGMRRAVTVWRPVSGRGGRGGAGALEGHGNRRRRGLARPLLSVTKMRAAPLPVVGSGAAAGDGAPAGVAQLR